MSVSRCSVCKKRLEDACVETRTRLESAGENVEGCAEFAPLILTDVFDAVSAIERRMEASDRNEEKGGVSDDEMICALIALMAEAHDFIAAKVKNPDRWPRGMYGYKSLLVVRKLYGKDRAEDASHLCGSCAHFDPCFVDEHGSAHCALISEGKVNEGQSCGLRPSKYAARVPIAPAPLGRSR